MTGLLRLLRRRAPAVAAVEFAVAAPVMLYLFGGLVDFGMVYYGKGRLAAGVMAGAQYAVLNPSTATSSTIQSLVQNASGLSHLTVSVSGPTSSTCYCPSGSPPTLGTAVTCGTACNGAKAGMYVVISATYAYQPIMPGYSRLSNPHVRENATVQVQ